MPLLRLTIASLFYLQALVATYPQSQPQTNVGTVTDPECQKLKELADGGDKLTDAQLGVYSKCLLEHRVKSIEHPTFVPVIGQFQLNTMVPLGPSNGREGTVVK
jgi:hypothetical protein